MYLLIMNVVKLVVLVTPLVLQVLLLLIPAQQVLIMNAVLPARLVQILVPAVIRCLSLVVVMIRQRPSAAIPAIVLKLVARIAVRLVLDIIPVPMPALQNAEIVVITVLTVVLRVLLPIPVLMPVLQNVVLVVIIAPTVVLQVLLP